MFQQKFKLDLLYILGFIGAMLFQLAMNNRAMQSLIHHQCTVNIFFWLEFIVRLPIFESTFKLIDLEDYHSVKSIKNTVDFILKCFQKSEKLD